MQLFKMEYYYVSEDDVNLKDKTLIVKGEEYKHLSKILGKKIGEEITFTDGKGAIYESIVVHISKTLIECHIININKVINDTELKLILICSPLKNPSRFEFLIEKAVELGVDKILPVISDNTVVKAAFSKEKLKRLNKISQVSSLLSQRCYFPKIENSISFKDMLSKTSKSVNKIFMYEFADSGKNNALSINPTNEIYVLIGPEGGFSKREVELLEENEWQVHSLGDRKVRAETAAIISVYKILNKFY